MITSQGQFTMGYKIEINISYETGNQEGVKTCIINSMEDILLGEFANTNVYKTFKANYIQTPSVPIPIYIINESFYLDKRSIDTIRKTPVSFPPHNSAGSGPQIREFTNNYTDFSNNPNIVQADKDELVSVFRDAFIDTYKGTPSDSTNNNIRTRVRSITTLANLFVSTDFINTTLGPGTKGATVIGTKDFHDYIKTQYERLQISPIKKNMLEIFYKMRQNNLTKKSKYEFFLNIPNVKAIYKFINNYSSGSDSRYTVNLNTNEEKERIYKTYFKYVFPNKKDVSFLSDPDKDKILMFYNVFYIIQNIYLYDDTIIQVPNFKVKKQRNKKTKTKYYISNVRLLELTDDNIHFEIVEDKVIIFISATLKPIVENPTLQINYLIDDLENPEQEFSQRFSILLPKDINTKYSIYNKIYIHNNVEYKKNDMNIDKLYKYARTKKYVENKEELFLNLKTLTLFEDYLSLVYNNVSLLTKASNITSNIKYLIHKIFKFYNNKKIKNYYIKDTYVKYTDGSYNYYSIAKRDITDTSKKYEIILNLYKSSPVALAAAAVAAAAATAAVAPPAAAAAVGPAAVVGPAAAVGPGAGAGAGGPVAAAVGPVAAAVAPGAVVAPAAAVGPGGPGAGVGGPGAGPGAGAGGPPARMLFTEVDSPDARLEDNKIYKMAVVFRCYLDTDGKEPSFMRKLIAENCLSRAQLLDNAFETILYKPFDLPKNYLHNKLSNITKKQRLIVQKNSTNEVAKQPEKNINNVPNVPNVPNVSNVSNVPNVSIEKPIVVGGKRLIKRGNNRTRKYSYSSI